MVEQFTYRYWVRKPDGPPDVGANGQVKAASLGDAAAQVSETLWQFEQAAGLELGRLDVTVEEVGYGEQAHFVCEPRVRVVVDVRAQVYSDIVLALGQQ